MQRTRYSSQIVRKLEFSRQIFEEYWNIKVYENLSNGSQVVPCRRTDRRTYMTKLILAFRNFPNALQDLQISNFMKIL